MTKSLRFLLMSMFIMLTGSVMADYTSTFVDKNLKVGDGELEWKASIAATAFDTQYNRGVQFGSAKGEFTLTSNISVTGVTKITMIVSTNGTANANTISVKVGETAFGKEYKMPKDNNYEVTFQGTSTDGVIVISVNDDNKSVYFKSITVSCGDDGGTSEPEPVAADTLTVAQAIAVIDALENGKTTTETYFVKGFVVGDPDFQRNNTTNALYGNVNFTMADEKGGTTLLTVYRAKGFDNANFTEETISQLKADDVVVLNGKLQKYVKNEAVTPELTSGYLVTVNGTKPEQAPVDLKTAANIKAFLALTAGDEATLTLTNAQVTYINVNNNKTDLFVRDATGAIDLYELGIEATVGQLLNGTINVKLGANAGFVAAVKGTNELSSTIVASAGGDVTVTAIDPREAVNYYCDYVAFKNVTINNKKAFNEDGDSLVLFDRFSLGLIDGLKTDGTKYDLYGLMYDGGTKYGPELVVTKATLAGGGEIVDDPVNFTGAGTLENPYTVADLLQLNPAKITDYIAADAKVWVKGVIITSIKNNALETTPSQVSNIAIAAQAGETEYTATIPVELKTKTDFRTNLNVVDNPTNIGKEILLCGNILSYFQKPGVKNLSDYVLDGQQYTITSINEVKAAERFQGAIYNLSGQRVKTPAKGLFILNGKKYFVK